MQFLERYKLYLEELDRISQTHSELTDSEARERLRNIVEFYFVWGNDVTDKMQKRYSMASAAADNLVTDATKRFISDASRICAECGIPIGSARHSLLEDPEARTKSGNLYDVYLGSCDELQPPSRPLADRNYRYFSRKPDLHGSFIDKPLELTVDGKKAKIGFDYDVREYVCWFVGRKGVSYFSAKSKKEVLQNAVVLLRQLVSHERP